MAENMVAEEKQTLVSKKDLVKAWWRWTTAVEVPVSFDRMQALAFGYSMNGVMRKIYKDKPEELKDAMKRHTSMFNTNCDWGSIIHGITISLEEQRALGHEDEITPEMIQSLKIGLMGPLAGIGDSVDQGIVATIPLAIFVPMAQQGSVLAAFIPGLIYIAWSYFWSWTLFNKGYTLGKNSVLEILHSGAIKKVIDIASIVGLFMIGCLSASYVKDANYIGDVDEFVKDIYLRESEGVTGIGNFVAIPHGKSDSVTQVGIAIGKLNNEIEWETLDGQGVKLIFLFAVSNDHEYARNHMKLLAQIAGKLGNDENIEKLLNAKTVEELKEVFN